MIKKVYDEETGKLVKCIETIEWISPDQCNSESDSMMVMLKDGTVKELYYASHESLLACFHECFGDDYYQDKDGSYLICFDLGYGDLEYRDDAAQIFIEEHPNGIWYDLIDEYRYGEFYSTETKDLTKEVLLVRPDINGKTNHLELM